jgi:hypothetical protein
VGVDQVRFVACFDLKRLKFLIGISERNHLQNQPQRELRALLVGDN